MSGLAAKAREAFRNAILFSSAVRRDLLRSAPTDEAFFISLGLQVMATSVMAAVSMAFALRTGMHLPALAALGGGLCWGGVIYIIDRGLITTMKRTAGRRLSAVGGRILLSILLGACIAEPLTIWLFRDEVARQVSIDHQRAVDAAADEKAHGARAKEIARNDEQIAALQDAPAPLAPGSEQVQARLDQLQAEVAAARADRDAKQHAVTVELEGQSVTGKMGCGPVCRVKQEEAQQAQARLDDVHGRDDAEIAKLEDQLAALRDAAIKDGQTQKDENQKLIDGLRARNATLQNQVDADYQAVVDQKQDGLLAQIIGLWHVGRTQPAAEAAHILLALLLVTVDVLPVLNKVRFVSGTKRPYEIVEEAMTVCITEKSNMAVDKATFERETQRLLLQQDREVREQAAQLNRDHFLQATARVQRDLGDEVLRHARQEELRRLRNAGLIRTDSANRRPRPDDAARLIRRDEEIWVQ